MGHMAGVFSVRLYGPQWHPGTKPCAQCDQICCWNYYKIYTTNFYAYFLFCPPVADGVCKQDYGAGIANGECVQRQPIQDSGGVSSSGVQGQSPWFGCQERSLLKLVAFYKLKI